MKKASLFSVAFFAMILVGCSAVPTKTDQIFANVQTNYTPQLVLQTNVVTVFQTNMVVQTLTLTNSVGVLSTVYQTNLVPVTVTQTNFVVATNMVPIYTLTPNQTATAVAGVAGSVANLAAPGVGELVTGSILAALSIFLGWRNRQMAGKNDALSQAAGTLTQIIETGRELMSKTTQGQKAADAFTQWLITHQAETQTIGQISQIVKSSTNNAEAQAAANQILALIGQTSVDSATAPVAASVAPKA